MHFRVALMCGCFSLTVFAAAPLFEAAAIKPCRVDVPSGARTGAGISSPALLDIECLPVRGLIQMAYVSFATGQRITPLKVPIEGGPAWIDSERYDIQARGDGGQSQMLMHGPMLQRLLEDRLRLRLHRETREIPVYALSVAKGGPKLRAFREGSCNPYEITAAFPPPPEPENPCVNKRAIRGGVLVVDIPAATLDDLVTFYIGDLDRPVINRTGIAGRFDIHLEFTPDETMAEPVREPGVGAHEPSGPSIFTALEEQLGLKVTPTKGPGEFLVIDHVEKPSAN